MAKVLVVTSGKGGVGKTTSTAAIGAALAQAGQKVVVVDFDVGLRNLDLVMGAERRVVFDLINVVQGIAKLPQALIRDKRLDNLWLLPASQTKDKDALTEEGVGRIIEELRGNCDWVLCDSPAGIERGAMLAMRFADEAIIVTNPEVSSVRDFDRMIGMLDSKTIRAEKGERVEKHVLITRYDSGAGGARRDDHHRRHPRNPGDAAARHHSREPGCAARLQCRLAGYVERSRKRACTRLSRCDQASARRDNPDAGAGRAQGADESAVGKEGCMSMWRTAPIARERLQILLAHERGARGQPDLLMQLREEILAVVSRHVTLDPDMVIVKMERGKHVSTLEIDIELPSGIENKFAATG